MLDLEPLIVARLEGAVPEGTHVLTANDLAGVREQSQHTPAVHVYHEQTSPIAGENVNRAPNVACTQRVTQTWGAVPVVRNARGQQSADHARSEAADLINIVIGNLLGWLPGEAFSRLELGVAPRPFFGAGGVIYYPLLFTTRMSLTGVTADGRGSTAT